MTGKSSTTLTNQTTSMQQTKAPMITSNSVDLGSTTRSIMKNSSLKTQQSQPSYYEATNMNLWKKQEDNNNPTTTTTVPVVEQSPKSTTTSSSLTSSGGTNPATNAAATAAAAAAAASSSSSQKPKVRFNLDINYEKEREWNRVNKIIVDASKSEIEWTQEVEV